MARQNILYGTREAIKAYNDELGEELGCDGIEISFSSTCRPSHQFMEGKQYAIGGATKTYHAERLHIMIYAQMSGLKTAGTVRHILSQKLLTRSVKVV